MTRPPAACTVQRGLPGCDTGPAGRLGFVLREARAAWRSHRARTTTSKRTTVRTSTDDRHGAPLGADGRPDPQLGGTR